MKKQVDYLNHRLNYLVCKGFSRRVIFAFFLLLLLFKSKKSPERLGQECVRSSLGTREGMVIKLIKDLPEKTPWKVIASH